MNHLSVPHEHVFSGNANMVKPQETIIHRIIVELGSDVSNSYTSKYEQFRLSG